MSDRATTPGANSTTQESTLLSSSLPVFDENFRYVTFAVQHPSSFDNATFSEYVQQGLRNRFSLLSRQDIIDELASNKAYAGLNQELKVAGVGAGMDTGNLPASLLAKVLKTKLDEEEVAYKKRIAEAKLEAEASLKSDATDAPKPGTASKGKKQISPEKGKSDPKAAKPDPKAGDKGAKAVTDKKKPAATPEKGPKKKPGAKKGKEDEDEEEKIITMEFDDAPVNGPAAYFLLQGFPISAEFIEEVTKLNIPFNAMVNLKATQSSSHPPSAPNSRREHTVKGDSNTTARENTTALDGKSSLTRDTIENNPLYGDIVWVDIEDVTNKDIKVVFTEIAIELYKMVEHRKYYTLWLQKLNLVEIVSPSDSECAMDFYRSTMDSIPTELQSVPLMLYALLDQIEQNLEPKSDLNGDMIMTSSELDNIFDQASALLTGEDASKTKNPEIGTNHLDTIRYGDDVSARIFRARQLPNPAAYVQQAEEKMLQFSFVPGKYRVGMPSTPSLTVWIYLSENLSFMSPKSIERNMEKTQLMAFIPESISHRFFRQFALFQFEMMMSEAFPNEFHDFSGYNVEENLNPKALSQIFSKTLLDEPEVITYYHDIEDVLLVSVHVPVPNTRIDERDWIYQIPTKVGFSNWRKLNATNLVSVASQYNATQNGSLQSQSMATKDFGDVHVVYNLTVPGNLQYFKKIFFPYDTSRVYVSSKEISNSRKMVQTTISNQSILLTYHAQVDFENMHPSLCDADIPVNRRPLSVASFDDGSHMQAFVNQKSEQVLILTLLNGLQISSFGEKTITQRWNQPKNVSQHHTYEIYRKILHTGHVCRYMNDDSIVVYSPQGEVSKYDRKRKVWTVTTMKGFRFVKNEYGSIVKVETIKVSSSTDHFSRNISTTSEEKTIHVKQPDGLEMYQFVDGTKIIRDPVASLTRIECSHCCPVDIRNDLHSIKIWLPNRFNIVCIPNVSTLLETPDGQLFKFSNFILQYTQFNQESTASENHSKYHMDFTDGSVMAHDMAGNTCIIYNDGHIKYGLSDDEIEAGMDDLTSPRILSARAIIHDKLVSEIVSCPRLFIVREDGSGTELSQEASLEAFNRKMENHPDANIARESLIGEANATCLTYLLKERGETVYAKGYKDYSIQTTSIYQTSTNLLPKATESVVHFRQLSQFKRLSDSERTTLDEKLAKLNEWKENKNYQERDAPTYTPNSESLLKIKPTIEEAFQALQNKQFKAGGKKMDNERPQSRQSSSPDSLKHQMSHNRSPSSSFTHNKSNEKGMTRPHSSSPTESMSVVSPPKTPDDFYAPGPSISNESTQEKLHQTLNSHLNRSSHSLKASGKKGDAPLLRPSKLAQEVKRLNASSLQKSARNVSKNAVDSSLQDTINHSGYTGIHLSIENAYYGTLKLGNMYRLTFTLTNMTLSNYVVKVLPFHTLDIQCLYSKTPVPPGQSIKIELDMSPSRAGDYRDKLVIGEGDQTIVILISAHVIPANEFDATYDSVSSKQLLPKGVRLMGKRHQHREVTTTGIRITPSPDTMEQEMVRGLPITTDEYDSDSA